MGCDSYVADDLVQEMYIKVDRYIEKHNADIMFDENEVNFYFFWVTLRNLYMDYHRKRVNSPIAYVDELYDVIDEEVVHLDKDDFEKHAAIMEWFEDKDYEDMCNSDKHYLLYDKKKLDKFYLRRIFEDCYLNKKPLLKFSREANITYWSLRHTFRIIKKQIKQVYEARRSTGKDIHSNRD